MFLLLFAGVGTIQAQLPDAYVTKGAGVTDIAAIAANGTKVAVKGSSNNGAKDFMSTNYLSIPSQSNGWSNSITAGNLYVFEATGENVDGHPTYYLKNDSTGQYIKSEYKAFQDNPNLDDTSDAGINIVLTSNKAEAFKFTALRPTVDTGAGDRVAYSTTAPKTSTPDQYDWVFAYAESANVYFGAYGQYPFYAKYIDTNFWNVYEVESAPVSDALTAAYGKLGAYSPEMYVVGNQPGNISQEVHDALKAASDAILAGMQNSSITLAEANQLYTAYKTAMEAANDARVNTHPVAVGKYYYFVGHDGNLGMYDDGDRLALTSGFTRPALENVDQTIAKYIWQIEDAGDGKIYLKNFATGRYNGTNNGAEQNSSKTVTSLVSPGDKLRVAVNSTACVNANSLVFNILTPDNKGYNRAGTTRVCYWGGNDGDAGNFWHVYEVEQEVIDKFAHDVEKERLLTQMKELYSTATYVQHKGMKFNPASSNDGSFDGAAVVGDAAITSNNYLPGDQANPNANAPINLNDGDFGSIYHSAWGGNQPVATEPIYVQVDLGSAALAGNFEIKVAPRRNGDTVAPKRVSILTSTDGNVWSDKGDYLLSYNIAASTGDNPLMLTRVCVLNNTPVRYVRFVCKENNTMENLSMSGGFASMCLSELHIYTSGVTYNEDPDESYYQMVSAATRAEFEKQLAAAQAELSAGEATEATLNAFKAAYEALLHEMPDPQELLDAIANANTEIESLPEGDAIGYYDSAKKAELQTVLQTANDAAVDGMSRDEINSYLSAIDEALDAYKNSLILPTEGTVYMIRCATTIGANAHVHHALLYSNGNSSTANLLQMRQVANPNYNEEAGESEENPSRIDGIENPHNDLRFLWQVTSVKNGKIVLKNLATGFYIGNATANLGALTNVSEAVEHEVSYSGLPGSLYLKAGVDKELGDLYANFNGGAANMIGYYAPDGNCAFGFEKVNVASGAAWQFKYPVNIAADGYMVMTMPLNVFAPMDDTVYEVLGQSQDGDKHVLVLKEYTEEVLEAGVPYLVQISSATDAADEMQIDICDADGVEIEGNDILSVEYVSEAKESNALVGTLTGVTMKEGPIAYFNNGSVAISDNTKLWAGINIGNNGGYVKYIQTEESGDAYIELPAEMATGIAGPIVSANEKVDVYTISGVKIRNNVKAVNATKGLPAGIYVVGGNKVLVK